MRSFPGTIIVSYVLIWLRLWVMKALLFIGILTGRKDHRMINAVILRVYGLVVLIAIMGHVSVKTTHRMGGGQYEVQKVWV